jgi:hypothetical protein
MKNGDSNDRVDGCVKRLFMHQRERVDAETAADNEWTRMMARVANTPSTKNLACLTTRYMRQSCQDQGVVVRC